ncbi:MAG TPA: protein kinase [Terriglobales bacterium]|nr:protein kinase [Terriglobales bacterium]
MGIAAGTHLGSYEILGTIGAGGMGEVYRARDPRLGREVAIKVLPPWFSSDPQRLRRFLQEAQATAALDHPNILAVHDVGELDGSPYIVSELLVGETLREKIRAGPVPVRKAIDYAQQIARGLAAAHDKGIVHRDLKPENVFVTHDGRAKILDFGVAKVLPPKAAPDDPTCTVESDAGSVVGTAGYMAPEQARGKPADARTDLFALGAILYELLSGQRAFKGESPADTISAILHQDPPQLPANLPAALERIVSHCLEKDPDERFQSARDVVFDLESVTTTSASSAAQERRPERWWRAAMVLAGLALLLAMGALAGRSWLVPRATSPQFRRLTFRRGAIRMARFAPDGRTIVYGAAWDGNPFELFARQHETSDSRPLGVAGQVLSISASGEVALLLDPKVWNFVQTGTLAVMPLSGAAPRELMDSVQFAEWAPDGKAMAIVRFSSASGLSWIEYPAGKVLYRGSAWISHLRISPDGELLAFAQHIHSGDDGFLVVMDREGNRRFSSQVFTSLQGVAWRPDGKEVWFTGARSGSARAIHALDRAGKQRLVLRAPGTLLLLDIAANGRVLLTNENARKQLFALAPGDSKERNVSWLDWSVLESLSEDGNLILFDEGGEGNQKYGLYLRRLDGSLPKRIVDGYWGDLSRDGKWVIAQDNSDPPQFVLVPTGIGESRQVTHDDLTHLYPRFMPDGKGIVFVATTPRGTTRMYYQSLEGGGPVAITPEGSGTPPALITISPDGAYLIAPTPAADAYAMYPIHGGEPRPVKGVSTADAVVSWTADGKYLFVYRRAEVPARLYRVEIASGKRELFNVISPPDPAGVEDITNLQITRDGRSYAYTCPTFLADLYLVDGLK